MSRELKAAFLLRLRYRNDATAKDCGSNTDELISDAQSLAAAWIDVWKDGDGGDQRTSSWRPMPPEALAALLEAFWHIIILAAKNSDYDAPQQQRIVDLVNEKKNDVGTLKRSISLDGKLVQGTPIDSDRIDIAQTADGVVWSELPYFRPELFNAFLCAPPITSTKQWTNLHAFAARITAAGLYDLSFYAIWALFDALEVKEMYPVPVPGSGQTSIPAADRFYPVLVWFQFCCPVILQACMSGIVPPNQGHDEHSCRWDREGPEFVGHLALEAGIERSGFSIERWKYWRLRLETIRDESGMDTALQATHAITIKILEVLKTSESLFKV